MRVWNNASEGFQV